MARIFLIFAIIWLSTSAPTRTSAQTAPTPVCGVVETIGYPIDNTSFTQDDFGLFRPGYQGRHTGVDMAFERYGDAVKAIARGRVTYSDKDGWDSEKGVVIIEHTMPDGGIVYSLYGHMEPINGHLFPVVGQCVVPGEVVGGVGHPSRGAPHLHFEIRLREANAGGPGYSQSEPLDGGWLHPIDFIERWQLRLQSFYSSMISAKGPPVIPPIPLPDGGALIATETHIERQTATGELRWRLEVPLLIGAAPLPDGQLLARSADDQMVVVNDGQFSGLWKPDRALQAGPLRVGDSILFIDSENRAVSYSATGAVIWQAGPFGEHLEKVSVSGGLIAISSGRAGNFNLYLLDQAGKILFQAAAPLPIIPTPAPSGGFFVMVGPQVGRLDKDGRWQPLLDVGMALGRQAQVAIDPAGNAYVYPGFGQKLFAFDPGSKLRWTASLPEIALQPPMLAVGGGCLVYALTWQGTLVPFRATDGQPRGSTALYTGGARGHLGARALSVGEGDLVRFSPGYLTTATINGPKLAGLDSCDKP